MPQRLDRDGPAARRPFGPREGLGRPALAALAALPAAVPGLVAAVALLAVLQPAALGVGFLLIVLRQAAPLGIVALGQSLVVLNRSLDLSVGGVIALVNVVLAHRLVADAPVAVSFLAPLVIGGLVGAANGFLVARVRASAVIVTLGMWTVLIGLSYIVSQGAPGGRIHPELAAFAAWRPVGVPTAVLTWAGLTVIAAFVLRSTNYGLATYAAGNAPRAAFLAGLPTARILFLGHVASGLLAGLSGLMLSAYIGTGTLNLGSDLVLASIAATILGGVTFAGGRGSPIGVAGGALLTVLIGAVLTILGIGTPGKLVVYGLVIAVAAALAARRTREGM